MMDGACGSGAWWKFVVKNTFFFKELSEICALLIHFGAFNQSELNTV